MTGRITVYAQSPTEPSLISLVIIIGEEESHFSPSHSALISR